MRFLANANFFRVPKVAQGENPLYYSVKIKIIQTRGLYTFTHFLKFIYVLSPLALCMVTIQELFLVKSRL